MKIRAATFNIQCGCNHAKRVMGQKADVELDRVVDHIKKMDVDFCCINEITDYMPGTEYGQQPAYLAQQLGWNFAFAKAIVVKMKDGTTRDYGIALLSKHPIRSIRRVPIVTLPEERQEDKRYENRVLMIVELEINGKTVTVMNSHFGLRKEEIEKAVNTVLAAQETVKAPYILTGDFNITPAHPQLQRIKAAYQDTADILPEEPLTFPSHMPRRKIDYIFTDQETKTLAVEIPAEVVADHLPIVAELEV